MFEIFESKFVRDSASSDHGKPQESVVPASFGLHHFFERYAGNAFNNGLYRVVSLQTGEMASLFIRTAHPNLAERLQCFAFDWLGSLFCLDSGRMEKGAMGVLMLEPGTGQALKIPSNLASFHDEMLIQNADAALGAGFYQDWLSEGGQPPRFDQCIGYKKPLFLGGVDTVENLEVTDLDVYWTISAQLIHKVKGLPPGTKIGKVSSQ